MHILMLLFVPVLTMHVPHHTCCASTPSIFKNQLKNTTRRQKLQQPLLQQQQQQWRQPRRAAGALALAQVPAQGVRMRVPAAQSALPPVPRSSRRRQRPSRTVSAAYMGWGGEG